MQPFLRVCWLASSRTRERAAQAQPDADAVGDYLHAIALSGVTEASAAYQLVEGGPQQRSIMANMERMGRAMDVGEAYSTKPDTLVITALDTLDAAMALEAHLDGRTDDGPLVVASGVYREITFTDGVEDGAEQGFAPAIQFGVFDMRSAADERAVTEWYRDRRLRSFSTLPGGIRARRLVSACGGPAKFAIFYEFVSLEARMQHFEPMNLLDHEVEPVTPAEVGDGARLIADRTVHPPMSPSIGSLLAL